jgi:dihydroorotate dehydrogenase (fumarate)
MTMDLSTKFMGLTLSNPFMLGASPLVKEIDTVKRLEDAGAAAIVMNSLFEEQIAAEEAAAVGAIDAHTNSFSEALSYFPRVEEYRIGSEEYLHQIQQIKKTVAIPVIGSLNGVSSGGWVRYARMIAEAGADALELNLYQLAAAEDRCGDVVELKSLDLVKSIAQAVRIPVAVKISPYYTSVPAFARCVEDAGAKALVIFNRFYQPDIDIEKLEVKRTLELSDSSELLLRLRWLAILSGRVGLDLSATGGVHTATDAIKAIMAGADTIQMVSALLENGPKHLKKVRSEMVSWMEKHGYESITQMRGSMNLKNSPDPSAYERANYVHILQTWEP